MRLCDVLRAAGWIAGSLWPEQAVRALRGRDFDAAVARTGEALAVAEESVEVWEPGDLEFTRPDCASRAADSPAAGERTPDNRPAAGRTFGKAERDQHREAETRRALQALEDAKWCYAHENVRGNCKHLETCCDTQQPPFDAQAYLNSLKWPEPYAPLYAEKKCAVCGKWRGQHIADDPTHDSGMRCPTTFTPAADKRIAERLDGAK